MIIENGNWTIYIHINKINGTMYVGITSCADPSRRWVGKTRYKGCTKFRSAIDEFGWENFEHEIFARNLTKEEACNMEKLLIEKLNTIDNGYNIDHGGIDARGSRSEGTKQKLREARLKQVFTREQIEKGAAKRRGVKFSEERKKKLSEVQRKLIGRPVLCLETGVEYSSLTEAQEKTGIDFRNIYASAKRFDKGVKPRNVGYHWKFVAKKA